MKLHDLVRFRQSLCEYYHIDRSVQELTEVRDHLSNMDRDLDPQYSQYVQHNLQVFNDAIIKLQHQHGTVQHFLSTIDQHIQNVTHELFSEAYDSELRFGIMEHESRAARTSTIPQAARELILERIRIYSDWHFPGLELGCHNGEWTEHLVANDPLYLVDLNRRFVDQAAVQFPVQYQNRLRKYVLGLPKPGDNVLYVLPKEQFGFIFSWDYFNYLSLSTIKSYLEQTYHLLRPGGVMLFSYNDGETPTGAGYAESKAQSYTPRSMLLTICRELGYELVQAESFDSGVVNWIEIRRPGRLETTRSHQTLGEIKHI